MFKRILDQAGGVLLEMTLSVAALVLLFSGMMDVSSKIAHQNTLNNISQEIETILRGASITNGSKLQDNNKDIKAVHADLNLALEKLFLRHGEDFTKYEARAGIFVFEMPESANPVFYLWLGLKGLDTTYLQGKPCVKLMVPLELQYNLSYFVEKPASANPDEIAPTVTQASTIIPDNTDDYEFYELSNKNVEKVLDEFC